METLKVTYQFKGQILLLGTSKNPDYDPRHGQYITQDPIGLNGGWGLYSYAGEAPTEWVDPMGLEPGTMVQRGYPQNGSVWTDSKSQKTIFYDPNKKEVFQIETRNDIASSAKNDAAQPYSGYITHCQKGLKTKEYGTTKIYTTDTKRGRWIHGGGSGAEKGHDKLEPGKRSLAPSRLLKYCWRTQKMTTLRVPHPLPGSK